MSTVWIAKLSSGPRIGARVTSGRRAELTIAGDREQKPDWNGVSAPLKTLVFPAWIAWRAHSDLLLLSHVH